MATSGARHETCPWKNETPADAGNRSGIAADGSRFRTGPVPGTGPVPRRRGRRVWLFGVVYRRRVAGVVERLRDALNAHDLEAMVGLFRDDYRSEQPMHPSRAFVGRDQVRKNWSALFEAIADLRAELLRSAEDGGTAWAEWRWTGTKKDGTPFEEAIVTIMGLENGQIAWARLYGDEVERDDGSDIDQTVQRMVGR